MKRRDLIAILAKGVVGAAAAAPPDVWAQAPRTKLVLALSVPVMDLASAYYSAVPKKLGYWEREGVDVEYLTAGGSAQSFGLMESGQAQVINVGLPTLMSVVSKSTKPVGQYVTAFGNTLFMALEGGPTQSIADLKGAVETGLAFVEKASKLAVLAGPTGAAVGGVVGEVAAWAETALQEAVNAQTVAGETDLSTIEAQVAAIRATNDQLAAQIEAS